MSADLIYCLVLAASFGIGFLECIFCQGDFILIETKRIHFGIEGESLFAIWWVVGGIVAFTSILSYFGVIPSYMINDLLLIHVVFMIVFFIIEVCMLIRDAIVTVKKTNQRKNGKWIPKVYMYNFPEDALIKIFRNQEDEEK